MSWYNPRILSLLRSIKGNQLSLPESDSEALGTLGASEVIEAEIVDETEPSNPAEELEEDSSFEEYVFQLTGETSFDQTLNSFYDDLGDWE